jgi:rhamnosyltransferase
MAGYPARCLRLLRQEVTNIPRSSPDQPLRPLMNHRSDEPARPQVAAIIVAYHPEPGTLAQLIHAIETQVATLVLVCNSAVDIPETRPDSRCSRTIIRNEVNVGLATAQNMALKQCARLQVDCVLFLDQDSLPDADLVDKLLAAEQRLIQHGFAVGAVGPQLVDADTETTWPYLSAGWFHTREITQPDHFGVCPTDMLYSSGSLVRLAHFSIVGYFMESLFIDHVDLEWCYRASQHGLHFFGIPSIHMKHRMGEGHVRLFGRIHPIHSATRDYYVFRNSVILLGLAHIPVRWKMNEFVRLLPRSIFYGLLSGEPMRHIWHCLRGISSGISFHLSRAK